MQQYYAQSCGKSLKVLALIKIRSFEESNKVAVMSVMVNIVYIKL